ncbi:HEAT repeat domain-containing protein [Pseudomonas sp. GZD-222]|uniref:HEAT repeat domain-containing protein n=1 Tax=Pseudomonas sp. GZD-222 TaxID=3404805 RepID=UPI003BB4A3F3
MCLENFPESVDYKILWLRLKIAWYRNQLSPKQAQRLAEDVYKIVCDARLCGDDVLCRLGSACAGVVHSVSKIISSKLVSALKLPDNFVQQRALRFCARACFIDSAHFITPMLLSGEETVRNSAADALGQMGDVNTIPELIQNYLSSSSPMIFLNALEAVASIGSDAARVALERILRDQSLYQNLRWPAVKQLGVLGNPSALHSIESACYDRAGVVRSEAVAALGRFNNPKSISVVSSCLSDSEPAVRYAAVEALVAIGGRNQIDALLCTISKSDEDSSVISAAARAMLRLAQNGC